MKLSTKSREILENFSNINQSIIIRKSEGGKTLIRTKERNNYIFATAVLEEEFDKDVKLFDLNKLLSFTKTGDKEIALHDSHMMITDTNSKAKIVYHSENTIVTPKGELDIPGILDTFTLTKDQLSNVLNGGSDLSLEHLKFYTEDGKIKIQALTAGERSDTKDTYDLTIGETDKEFSLFVKRENLKMIAGDYKVNVVTLQDGKTPYALQFINQPDTSLWYGLTLEIINE